MTANFQFSFLSFVRSRKSVLVNRMQKRLLRKAVVCVVDRTCLVNLHAFSSTSKINWTLLYDFTELQNQMLFEALQRVK